MKKSTWGIVGLNLVIMGLVWVNNPLLLSSQLLISKSENLVWKPTLFKEDEIGNLGISFYRNSPQRRALFPVTTLPRSFKRLWLTEEINSGIHSASKASPVSDGEAIFVGGDTGWFYSFSLEGNRLWKFYAGEAWQGIHSTAAIDHHSVYVGSYRGTLYRLDKKSGDVLWASPVGETIGASPLLDGEFLIVPVETFSRNGYVVKVKRKSGELVWRSDFLGEQSHSSLAQSQDQQLLYLGANNSTFFALENATGKIKWRSFLDGQIKSTPLVKDDHVLVTTWGGTLYSLHGESGRIRWKVSLGASSQVSPTFLEKSRLVVASNVEGTLFAFELESGKKKFELPLRVEKNLSSPIILSAPEGERILAACELNKLCLVTDKGKVDLRISLSARMTSSPLVMGKRLFVSLNESGLEAFEFD